MNYINTTKIIWISLWGGDPSFFLGGGGGGLNPKAPPPLYETLTIIANWIIFF